jgi:predicted RNA-binding protein with PUA-like domain
MRKFEKCTVLSIIVAMKYWLVKSEPFKYSWDDLVKDGSTYWDGVRNYQARNNMKLMKKGDLVLYYHSNEGKEVVGVAKVIKEHYQDPTTDDDRWVVVDIKPVQELNNPVTLSDIKSTKSLQKIPLVTHSRLSVMPVLKKDFDTIVEMGK